MSNQDLNMMDWNDTIENDGQEFVLLPEGDYKFKVINFERGRFPGGAKVPPCNKAIITIEILHEGRVHALKFDLLLYRSVEWKLSSFFRCIGQKKHGEKLVMNWNKVLGSVGNCHVKQKKYINQYNEEKTINEVDKFYDYDPNEDNFLGISDDELPF